MENNTPEFDDFLDQLETNRKVRRKRHSMQRKIRIQRRLDKPFFKKGRMTKTTSSSIKVNINPNKIIKILGG